MKIDVKTYPEFSLIMEKLNCSDGEIKDLIKLTRKHYPSVDNDRDAVHIVAKNNNLQFNYNSSGKINGLEKLNEELDVDLALFLE